MLPEDFQDLIIAFVLVILLVVVGSAFQMSNFSNKEEGYQYESEGLSVNDDEKVFFLNLLKTKVDDKSVGDLIILGENSKESLDAAEDKIKEITNFYGKDESEYGLMINYPNKEKEYSGCEYEIEKGIEQKLPSLNSGVIELRFTFYDIDCRLGGIEPTGGVL